MGFNNNRDGIEVQTSVNVSLEDIKDACDFEELVQLYEPDTQELLRHADDDAVIEYAATLERFSSPHVVQALLDNEDFQAEVLKQLNGGVPEVKPLNDTLPMREGQTLFRSVKVGQLQAVIAGGLVRFRNVFQVASTVGEFRCEDYDLALRMLQGLAMLPAESNG